MPQLKDLIVNIFEDTIQKAVFSNPAEKDAEFKKITISRMPKFYQITKFTEKQVFHENIDFDNIAERCIELFGNGFTQIYARSQDKEYNVKIGKDGKVLYKTKNLSPDTKTDIAVNEHNRKKQYILAEGEIIEPLIDMGIFTKDGKVINSMYDKYKQINRLIEIIDDSVKQMNTKKLNVIDFGCGKSYLTFIVYYYLTEIKK